MNVGAVLVGNLEGRIALGRPRRKKENNTDVDLKEAAGWFADWLAAVNMTS